MAIGFGLLRLSSKTFWAMTPREFERAASPYMARPISRPDRRGLATLMNQFPDSRTKEK